PPGATPPVPGGVGRLLPLSGDRISPRGDGRAGGEHRAVSLARTGVRMSFLSPLAFALVGLTLPLALLYFLKVRRRERQVSSLLLWDTTKRDREASAFFQRLQRDPLIILQVLA